MLKSRFIANVGVLALCQALFFMCNTIVISTTALVGLDLAPMPHLATIPLGIQFLVGMTTSMPASLLMKRFGRRKGLAVGMIFGILAGLLSTFAIFERSFAIMCIGAGVYGVFSAFCQFFRFAAADAADVGAHAHGDATARRGRAISIVLAGGIVAAVAGPELAKGTTDLFAPVIFAGCYAAVAVLAAFALVTVLFLDLPLPSAAERNQTGRSLHAILRQGDAVTACLSALVGYVTMNLLMTATPLAMIACGHLFADSAFVIQWHVLGMFAPSFFTGWLIGRMGVHRLIATGVLLNLLCIAVGLSGLEVVHFTVALFLLGVGWNFMFIGGTTLLTSCHTPAEKAKVQGANDLVVFSFVAVSASLSGLLHEWLGWEAMNLLALPGLLLVLAVVLPRTPQPRTVTIAG